MKNIQSNTPNIFIFERKFREIIYEVQRNTVNIIFVNFLI